MRPVVVFPDIEAWLCGWLRDQLDHRTEPYTREVFVANTIPDPRRDRMVILRRDGGPRLDVVRETAILGIRIWGRTDAEATDLANLVRALVAASVGEGPVRQVVESSAPSAVADPSSQPLRYLTVEVTARA